MKVSPGGLFGGYANVPPAPNGMWDDPTYGMWNRQTTTIPIGGYSGVGRQLGSRAATPGLLGGQARELAFRNRPNPVPAPGAPTTPIPGMDGMISPDFIRQILGGGGGGLLNFAQF